MGGRSVCLFFFSVNTSTFGTTAKVKSAFRYIWNVLPNHSSTFLYPCCKQQHNIPQLWKARIRRQGEGHFCDIRYCLSQCSVVKLHSIFVLFCFYIILFFSLCLGANKRRKQNSDPWQKYLPFQTLICQSPSVKCSPMCRWDLQRATYREIAGSNCKEKAELGLVWAQPPHHLLAALYLLLDVQGYGFSPTCRSEWKCGNLFNVTKWGWWG